MLDPSIGRWFGEDPIDFGAGDANLYRDRGNNPTNATDPSGLQTYPAGIQVTNPGQAVPLPKSDGKILLGQQPLGTVTFHNGLNFSYLAGNNLVPFEGSQVRIEFTPAANANVDLRDVDIYQYFWAEAKELTNAGNRNLGLKRFALPGDLPVPENYIRTNAGLVELTLNPAMPIWTSDVTRYAKLRDPRVKSFIDGGFFGGRTNTVALYDNPQPTEALYSVRGDHRMFAAANVTGYQMLFHFDTYIVYKNRPVFHITWDAETKVGMKLTDKPSPTSYTVTGAGPVSGFVFGQLAPPAKPLGGVPPQKLQDEANTLEPNWWIPTPGIKGAG